MKQLKNKSKTIFSTAMIVGLCFLVFLSNTTSSRDISEHSKILGLFEQSKILNHDIHENILRLKTFLLQTYDPLVRDTNKQIQICSKLQITDLYHSLNLKSTRQLLNYYCSNVKEAAELIENYKRHHAVLRNSIKYLPTIVKQIAHKVYKSKVHEVFSETLLFNLEPTPELEVTINKLLQELPSGTLPQQERMLLSSFKLHVNLILKKSSMRIKIEEQILSNKVLSALEKLELNYIENYQYNQRKALVYHYSLIILCLCLGVWLSIMFTRLQETGENLRDLNLNLEGKVSQRTEELAKALEKISENQSLLAQSAKMTALGEMAGGIAHEINTPLSAVLMNAEILKEKSEKGEAIDAIYLQKRTDNIIKIVERISKIIGGLKRFSRNSDPMSKSVVSVKSIIDDTLALCNEKFKSQDVILNVQIETESLSILCVPEHISQVLLNFLNNSLYALKEIPDLTNKWVRIDVFRKAEKIEISVTDAGLGLPESVQLKLTQPFFTTKPPGIGTGLGLSISRGIVEQNGGKLFYDKASPNTRFVIQLPEAA